MRSGLAWSFGVVLLIGCSSSDSPATGQASAGASGAGQAGSSQAGKGGQPGAGMSGSSGQGGSNQAGSEAGGAGGSGEGGAGAGGAGQGGSAGSASGQGGAGAGGAGAGGAGAGGAGQAGAGQAGAGGGGAGQAGEGGAGAAGEGGAAGQGGAGGAAGQGGEDTLAANRDRLLQSYLAFLKEKADKPQSNGLSGANVASVCEVWSKMAPAPQSTFLAITARMQKSLLGSDGRSMLWHVTRVLRIAGGEGATAGDKGSCGGGEYNRLMLSIDGQLHAALAAANEHQGAKQPGGKFDIADAPPKGTFWRQTKDLAGPHGPFDMSDETDQGGPRAQAHFFKDTGSTKAQAPLGRVDLESLVEPFALEIDQDYDCIHDSNPLCEYITYGPLCLPGAKKSGLALQAEAYGDLELAWLPAGCP